jgi:hypothetical protein
VEIEIEYKGVMFAEPLKLDLYIDQCLLVELKAVEAVLPIHKAQLFSYMKLLDAPLGLLINWNLWLVRILEFTFNDGAIDRPVDSSTLWCGIRRDPVVDLGNPAIASANGPR